MSSHELPPLPEAITKDIEALREIEPSMSLVERAMASLPSVPNGASVQTNRQEKPSSRKSGSTSQSILVFMIPAAAAIAGATVFFSSRSDVPNHHDMVRVEERTVALPESGNVWTSIDLQTHHHADEPAIVHLEVPTNVRVRLPSADGTTVDEKHCLEKRCVHRFTQHHGQGVPLRIAVTHPGRYDIHVRHESKVAAMREHFVLVASRE